MILSRITAIAAAIAIAVGTLVAGAAPRADAATALSTCYASSCTGHPAASYTCVNDAEVIYSVNITSVSTVVGNIQLKYSPSCRATWARVISNLGYGAYAIVQSNNNSNLSSSCSGGDTAGTGCNTNMINDANMTSYATGGVYVFYKYGNYYAVDSTASF